MGTQVDMHACTNACTHLYLGMEPEKGDLDMQAGPLRITHVHTIMHVLIHVHILTKVWKQRRVDWESHMAPHRSAHVCAQLHKKE